jgi:predicted aspartyl protease
MRTAEGKIRLNGRELKAIFDSGADFSVISKRVADQLGGFTPTEPYYVETAKEKAKMKIIGFCVVPEVEVLGEKVPGRTFFEVSDELVNDVIIGTPEMDRWKVELARDGPRLMRRPIRLRII